MIVRWVLTIIAIIVFSWITAKIVKDEDLPQQAEKPSGLTINEDACMGCTLCTQSYPELFTMQGKKAYAKELDASVDKEKLRQTALACPVKAIDYVE